MKIKTKSKGSKKESEVKDMSFDNFLENMEDDSDDGQKSVKKLAKTNGNKMDKFKLKNNKKEKVQKKVVETKSDEEEIVEQKSSNKLAKTNGHSATNGTKKDKKKLKTNKKEKLTKQVVKPDSDEEEEEFEINSDSEEEVKEVVVRNKKKSSKKVKKSVKPEIKDSEEEEEEEVPEIKVKKSKKLTKKSKKPETDSELSEESENDDHKESLEKLKEIDPAFYKFLQQNDKKLLQFNDDDNNDPESKTKKQEREDEEDNDDDDDDEEINMNEEEDDDDEDLLHKPNSEFEVGSDESDFEADSDADEDSSKKSNNVTLKMLRQWQEDLCSDKVQVETIKNVTNAFNSALASISEVEERRNPLKVDGSAVFNGVLQLCVLHLQPAIKKYLGVSGKSFKMAHKCKKWNKVKASLKNYIVDLTKLLENVSTPNILSVVLKHLHQMCPLVSSFQTIAKPILKRLVAVWSTAEDTVRVVAFLCILKITRSQQTQLLSTVLKAMYLSYVRNSKFISPGTLPAINFMRRSLTEMFALDLNVSYQHSFLYIRQLAIHLRNALTLKKKESFQSVYNWQFINSLRLWADVLGMTYNKPQLQPLIYPLVSIITGVIKLIPTAQYFPLRFHCVQILSNLSKETRVFIPTLPFVLEVLNSGTFNKKHDKVSMKPMQFTCILRVNKGQMAENGFRDEIIENVYGLILEYMAYESFSVSYPDMAIPCILQLKQYLKNCKNSQYNRKIRQLCDKIEENSRFVENERNKIAFTLKDHQLIGGWETSLKNKGTPLMTFYQSWVKTHETKKKRQAASSDDINDYDLPVVNKRKLGSKVGQKVNQDGQVELFPSDSEDNDDDDDLPVPKKHKKEKKQKLAIEEDIEDNYVDDGIDIVKDLNLDDWD